MKKFDNIFCYKKQTFLSFNDRNLKSVDISELKVKYFEMSPSSGENRFYSAQCKPANKRTSKMFLFRKYLCFVMKCKKNIFTSANILSCMRQMQEKNKTNCIMFDKAKKDCGRITNTSPSTYSIYIYCFKCIFSIPL